MHGLNETDWLGDAGDVNDDGFANMVVSALIHDGVDDLLLGAHMTDNTGTNAGSAYVIYGNDVIFSDAFESSP